MGRSTQDDDLCVRCKELSVDDLLSDAGLDLGLRRDIIRSSCRLCMLIARKELEVCAGYCTLY